MLPADTIIAGKYKLLGTLGEGGMAIVYKAEHLDVGLQVAIKVMHRDYSRNSAFLERFRREARAAAAIGHDNVVKVLDYGVHDERPFMVMELLRGESLATRLEREPVLAVETAAKIIGQVLMALTAAQNAGIVHRDLKPENVFLTAHGNQEDVVKLLDFGISKFSGGSNPNGIAPPNATHPGAVMGTPHYMSPEQAKARPDVDIRADVYSTGVMLYEMLAGAQPFTADSEAEILAMICYRPHEPRRLSELNPDVPPEIEAVVTRAMAYEVNDRYATPGEMLEEIRPFAEEALAPRSSMTGRYQALSPARSVETPMSWSARTPSSPGRSPSSPGRTPSQPARRPSSPGRNSSPRVHLETLAEAPPEPKRRSPFPIVAALALAGATAIAFAVIPRHTSETHAATTTPAAAIAAQVRIELAGLPDNARASIDGQPIAGHIAMLARNVQHALRVEAPGRVPFETELTPQEPMTVQVALPEVPAPVIVAAPAPAPVPAAPAIEAQPARSAHTSRPRHAAGGVAVHPTGSFVSGTAEY